MATATINLDQLISEFGTWIGKNQTFIKTLLLQPTVSTKYMSPVIQDDDYRASKATIDDLVQGFQKGWTPKGTPTFTPIWITHKRHKVDINFYPDEVVGTWLGFLANEGIDRREWPITRYIIEKLMMQKIAQNRELKLYGKGTYVAPVDGVAQAVGLSMDGFCTILKAAKISGTTRVNFINLGTFDHNDIVAQVNAFVAKMNEVYQDIPMNLFMSRAWYRSWKLRNKELFGIMPLYPGMADDLVDGTNLTLTPLPSMAGENIMFATPQENFIWLKKVNNGPSTLSVELQKREISIYCDWHESIGFAIGEAVFAAISDTPESASV